MRTTVLVRRQHRRDKIEAAKVAAVEGVKEAGRKGLAASAAGAEAAGQAAVKMAKSAAEGAAEGAEKGLALLVRAAAAARSRIAAASAPLNARLSTRRVSFILAALAVLGSAGCAMRAWQFGTDADAVMLGAAALAAGLAWLWPRVFSNSPEAEDEWTLRTERVVVAVDRAGSLLPVGTAAACAAVALWFAAPTAGRWFETAGPLPSRSPSAKAPVAGDVIQGTARVAGPGLIRIGNSSVRLNGVTMLDFAQTCRRSDGSTWTCGAAAEKSFEKLVRSRRPIRCEMTGEADGIRSGTCELEGKDLAAELVRQGFAFADGSFWSSYSAQQSEAQEAKAGLWSGEPERPDAWRDRIFADAAANAPGGCPIKGRIQSGRRTYLLPQSANYPRISIREERGDRWFCSAEEAEAAGFQVRDAKR
ncbi:MAG: thermonuclease family protein [Hyphomicrobium sp.]|nr:thermonuclease family protein [Hyphomicrobium sp.]